MVSGTLAPLYSFWVKVGLKRGSGPDRGRSPVEWGDFPSVRPYLCPSIRLFPPSSWLALRPGWMGLRPAWLALGPSRGGTDGRTDGRTNGRTENLPILQDFVPYRGRCPKIVIEVRTTPHVPPLI